jgi:hypothetical protein
MKWRFARYACSFASLKFSALRAISAFQMGLVLTILEKALQIGRKRGFV